METSSGTQVYVTPTGAVASTLLVTLANIAAQGLQTSDVWFVADGSSGGTPTSPPPPPPPPPPTPDTVVGTRGNDVLYQSASGSKMTGGVGADKFVFTHFVTASTITDFRPGQDKTDLSAFHLGANALKDKHAWLSKVGNATQLYVDLDAGGPSSSLVLVTLQSVTPQKISAHDFIFG